MSTKIIQELANISTLRNHLWLLINGPRNLVQRTDVSELSLLIQKLDFKRLDNYRHYHLFNYNVQQIPKHKCGMSIRC